MRAIVAVMVIIMVGCKQEIPSGAGDEFAIVPCKIEVGGIKFEGWYIYSNEFVADNESIRQIVYAHGGEVAKLSLSGVLFEIDERKAGMAAREDSIRYRVSMKDFNRCIESENRMMLISDVGSEKRQVEYIRADVDRWLKR